MPRQDSEKSINRRQFVQRAAAGGAAVSILKAETVRGYAANSKIQLGLVGCGGRGTWIAALFKKHGGYEIVGAADYFQDRVDTFGTKIGVDASRRYTGLSNYKRLLDAKTDAVAIISPPCFHPDQAAAAVAAGAHVYLAKPIAVDVPGCNLVAESAKKSTANKRVFLVDFQTRVDPFFQEAIKRVHAGAIGDIAFAEATYHAENPFEEQYQYLESDPHSSENRLRAWGLDRAISGDIITEQNIHTLDVASWIMNQEPLWAVGTGGLTARPKKGTCWDHFVVQFQYPNNVGIAFTSRQFNGHGTVPEGIRNRAFGSKGVLETEYGGKVLIRGENFYKGGESPNIYQEGAVNNIAAFHKNVTEGNFENSTVPPSVRSNLVTILGRTAAIAGKPVTWEEMLRKQEVLDPGLKGLKD